MPKFKIAASSEVRLNEMIPVQCDGKKLLLTRTSEGLSVFDRKCTHLGADLCKGKIDQGEIVCPWHGARFDATNGQPRGDAKLLFLRMKVKPLAQYVASEADGAVFVDFTN